MKITSIESLKKNILRLQMKCIQKTGNLSQSAITYSKLTIETLEQDMKYVQS